jgi:hypothetical protein
MLTRRPPQLFADTAGTASTSLGHIGTGKTLTLPDRGGGGEP